MMSKFNPGYPEEYDFDLTEESEKMIKRAEKLLQRLFDENEKSMMSEEEVISGLKVLLEQAIEEIETR